MRMLFVAYIVLLISITFGLGTCTSTTPTPGIVARTTASGGFPFPVGTTWVYSRVEYQQVIGDPTQLITATRLFTDTVTRIEGSAPSLSFLEERTVSSIHAPPNSSDWMLLNPWINRYLIRGNQIFETRSANHLEDLLLYDFPLETNKRWCVQPLQPANASDCYEMGWREAQRRASYATPVGQFDECYQILDPFYTGGAEWFCDGVGVVAHKYDHAGTRFGFEDKLLRLSMGSLPP